MNSSEETFEDLHAEFKRVLNAFPNDGSGELTRFGNKLRKKYFEQIEHIEQKFQNAISSNSHDTLKEFLFDKNFIFRAISANVVIYNNCDLANNINVDCILVGFKPFDAPNFWITFTKLEQADFILSNSNENIDKRLLSSALQVNQWLNWQKENATSFEAKIRERLRKDLANTEYKKILDSLEMQIDFIIIAGYEGEHNPKQPYLSKTSDSEFSAIKTISYGSLFKTIYEDNNKAIMSSGWWTEDICKTENAIVVVKDVSFKE